MPSNGACCRPWPAAGCGTVIDPSSDSNELPPGTVVELPLWLIRSLAQRNMVHPELPVFYGSKMRRKIKVPPGAFEAERHCRG